MFKALRLVVGGAIVLTQLAGCEQVQSVDDKSPKAVVSSSLAAKGKACGNVLSLMNVKSGSGKQPTKLSLQIAICGELPGKKAWKAIGAGATVPTVFVRPASAGGFSAGDGQLSSATVNEQGKVFVIVDGKELEIGKAASQKNFMPIALAPGFRADLVLDGKPYDVAQGKPQSETALTVWVTTP